MSGEGNADVETGSSAIRLSGIRGAVIAATRSGRISLQGVPRRDWNASTGSGSVDIATESSVPVTLDASSGSGSVKVIGASVQGSVSKRKVAGSIAGGGPLVKVSAAAGPSSSDSADSEYPVEVEPTAFPQRLHLVAQAFSVSAPGSSRRTCCPRRRNTICRR